MPATALHLIATKAELKTAWEHISLGRKSKPSFIRKGLDCESMQTFEQRLEYHLSDLATKIKENNFSFSKLEPIFIPKSNGKERLICVPIIRDRLVQRAILNFLKPRNGWMQNGVSFGFVPEMTVYKAVDQSIKLRNSYPWVFKTDITSFFDRIDRDILCDRIKQKVKQKSLLPLLNSALKCEIYTENIHITRKIRKLDIRTGRGVRQGMPLSPYFANVILEPFDQACIKKGMKVVRYADDLAFFAGSLSEAKEIENFCINQLKTLSLEIPALADNTKTKIYQPKEPVDFLGVELTLCDKGYSIRISSAQMQEIKNRLYAFGDIGELRKMNLDITRFGNSLESRIKAYEASYDYCSNFLDFIQHLHSCKTNAIKRTMRKLGVNVDSLKQDEKWFLGIN